MRSSQIICACITGPGPGAVGGVRLSGAGSWSVAARIFSTWPSEPQSHKAVFGHLPTGDDGLALPFSDGHGFTGEEAVEFFIHGSPASIRALLDLLMAEGARPAEPGEFSLRAFMNGRLDLAQAEGVKMTVEAETSAQLKLAKGLREGALSSRVSGVREELIGVLAAIEAATDFSEEAGDLDVPLALQRLSSVLTGLNNLQKEGETSRIGLQGLRVALVGPPNAGKSSLLNTLLQQDRAIVTNIPGTTRDTLEETLEIHGLKVVLIDTAGLRETDDLVERLGLERSRQAMAGADLVWQLYDSSLGWTEKDEEIFKDQNGEVWVLAAKADLVTGHPSRGIPISVVSQSGLDQLLAKIKEFAPPPGAAALLPRHAGLLAASIAAVMDSIESLNSPVPTDLAAVPIQAAIRILGEVTGETTPPDVITRIFHDFCIGK